MAFLLVDGGLVGRSENPLKSRYSIVGYLFGNNTDRLGSLCELGVSEAVLNSLRLLCLESVNLVEGNLVSVNSDIDLGHFVSLGLNSRVLAIVSGNSPVKSVRLDVILRSDLNLDVTNSDNIASLGNNSHTNQWLPVDGRRGNLTINTRSDDTGVLINSSEAALRSLITINIVIYERELIRKAVVILRIVSLINVILVSIL